MGGTKTHNFPYDTFFFSGFPMAYRVAISWGGEDFSDSKAPLKIRMMEPVFFFLKVLMGHHPNTTGDIILSL